MIRYFMLKLQHNTLLQIIIISLIWIASDLLAKSIRLPISGGILGLGFVLVLLSTKIIKINTIQNGARLFLKDIMLFFIPSLLALLEHNELLGILGLKIIFVIVCSTIAVMLVTAFVVDYCYYWRVNRVKPLVT